MSVFLGIDIGTSGTKTLAIDSDGRILADAMETSTSTAKSRLRLAREKLQEMLAQRGVTGSAREES